MPNDKEVNLDFSGIYPPREDEGEDEQYSFMLTQLLLPPDPDRHPREERSTWIRKRRLWFRRRAFYLRKGWPDMLASLGARFSRSRSFWRRQERYIDQKLASLKREGYSDKEIDSWIREHLMTNELLNRAMKNLMDKYRDSLRGEEPSVVRFFK